MQGQELESMIPMGPFQLRILLYDSVNAVQLRVAGSASTTPGLEEGFVPAFWEQGQSLGLSAQRAVCCSYARRGCSLGRDILQEATVVKVCAAFKACFQLVY